MLCLKRKTTKSFLIYFLLVCKSPGLNTLVYSYLTCFSKLFLNNGTIFVSLHSNGTSPSSSDKMNTVASGMLICSTISNGNLGGIPSTPGGVLPSYHLCSYLSFLAVQLVADSLPSNLVSGTGNEQLSSLVNTELKG